VQAWNLRSADEARETPATLDQRQWSHVLTIAVQEIKREEEQLVVPG
jgi:hypothetical protein